ncbi:hypothetical protein SAMN05216360_1232 [Methylobacterium phyllostachyos]|uniref:Uncharacterized protein n=1 Tax=Methylobacterium phyllostachyos TaxID=582672 RepID=A0A1H0JKH5_9HYPH|nr:hypothetical protein [Methylobacterium phyllostachyos]SDO44287.1 hypothetical protein SAMN05216360_1232 [Methylobacterium phyllostachyos]
MTFSRKYIDVSISLSNGEFQGGGNTAKLSGLRVLCGIENAGSPDMGKATVSIYGLPLTLLNQLTQMPYNSDAIGQNTITIMPREKGGQSGIGFKGTIIRSFADIEQPLGALRVDALAGVYEAVAEAKPTSRAGSTDVAQLMGQLANMAGLTLENNDVQCKVMNPYLPSSARQQIKSLARMAGINWYIENGTLAIWPKNGSRQGASTQISPQTGMRGYPRFTASGIEVTTLYNASFKYGGSVEVQSDLKPACGIWYITNSYHELESETPRGKWFTTLSCSKLKI